MSKCHVPEFLNFVHTFDILGIQESKTDDTDNICIPGYQIFYNNREKLPRRRSGGIVLLVKNDIAHYVKVDNHKLSKLILWFTLSHEILNLEKDINFGVVYIPPQGSKYASDDPYMELQREILRYCPSSDQTILMGDFNSRTGENDDFCLLDDHMRNEFGLQTVAHESQDIVNLFVQRNISLKRVNPDKNTNYYGNQMLEFCKATNLLIMNGRIGDNIQDTTFSCKDKSTIDYFLSTANLFDIFTNLRVLDFNPLFSDAHCPVSILAEVRFSKRQDDMVSKNNPTVEKIKLWDSDKSNIFVHNFDLNTLSEIGDRLSALSNNEDVKQDDIEYIVTDIGKLFSDCAELSFGKQKFSNIQNSNTKKPWFNAECRRARNQYHYARKTYNKIKSEHNKQFLRNVSKIYKCTINKCIKKTKQNRIAKLKSMKNSNAKEYWKFLNSDNETSACQVPISELYNFFKDINSSTEANQDDYSQDRKNQNYEINEPINDAEIQKAINHLHNGKSSGIDNIKNEHIKSTSDVMLPIYRKLFNIILDSGIIPESWSIGIIKPIYKNKGDPLKPENYRPITILSCLGKLFTLIINNRLTEYTKTHNTIGSCQAGFRQNHSTADNLFIIKSLIDIARSNKNKLHCCFVDFKQAFDTVWRPGLWSKLLQHDINGKCFNVIRNLYANIKSKVTTNNESSAYFPCMTGVRQGENLSPILFSIYLNDLHQFLMTRSVNGLTVDIDTPEIVHYLKLLILLYADDTVLFGTSAEDLQHSLSVFQDYCKEWHLTVNIQKTKVLIFTNKRRNTYTFKFDGQILEIVDEYKYLGIYLSKSGSFKAAKQHIAEQANKALFALLKKSKTLDLPFDIQIDLFDKTVKPILLYGAELWGYGNCDILERIHIKFLKYLFNLKKSTPSYMIYGELGIIPISVEIQSRVLSFWCRLVEDRDQLKLSAQIYLAIHAMHTSGHFKSDWLRNIENLLCSLGFSGIWQSQHCNNFSWLRLALKQKLKDLYIQKWLMLLNSSSSSGCNFRLFKTNFECSKYLQLLPENMSKTFLKFRTRNHKLPNETGRWVGIPLPERKCRLCLKGIGDEYHYLLSCIYFKTERKRLIKPYYFERANILKYHDLMNTENIAQLKDLCKFIRIIISKVSQI